MSASTLTHTHLKEAVTIFFSESTPLGVISMSHKSSFQWEWCSQDFCLPAHQQHIQGRRGRGLSGLHCRGHSQPKHRTNAENQDRSKWAAEARLTLLLLEHCPSPPIFTVHSGLRRHDLGRRVCLIFAVSHFGSHLFGKWALIYFSTTVLHAWRVITGLLALSVMWN